jgi:hypothetical protein
MAVHIEKSVLLRIGIIIDSFVQPRWVHRALEKILTANLFTIELVVKVQPENSNTSLLHTLYNRIDRRLFPAVNDALGPVSIEGLLESVPVTDQLDDVSKSNLDVLINFGPSALNPKCANAAKHGVWFYVFGTGEKVFGFREVMTHDPLTISSLRSLSGDPPKEQLIYQSVSPTLSAFSVGLNNNTCYWKSAAFLVRGLVGFQDGHRNTTEVTHRSQNSFGIPTNAVMSRTFLTLSCRAAARVFQKLSSVEQWVLAYKLSQSEFQYLIPPAGRFWADPFPIETRGKYYIFFEDYFNRLGKAHISVIEVNQNGIVNGPTPVLELDCHLSYPFVFEWRGEYYMIPETGDKNEVQLYRSVSFPFEWQFETVLLEGNCPLDATLIEVNGVWWMFVNIQEDGVVVNWDELHLYYADNPRGPWKPHARNPVVSDVRSARPAGRLFWSNNVLYRPSQDSSVRYGYATTINRVNHLTQTEYSETEVDKLLPNWDKNIIGIHTLNGLNEITVIDCLTRRRRFGGGALRPPRGLGITDDLLQNRAR